MRSFVRYLLLVFAASAAAAGEPEPARVNCTVEAPDLPGELVAMTAKLKFERLDQRAFATATFSDDGQGAVALARGGRYRVRPIRMVLVSENRPLTVHRAFIQLEPAEIWIPASGPLPEPRFTLGLRRGKHALRLEVASRTGQPIPAARVRVTHQAEIGGQRTPIPYGVHETNAAGEIVVERLPAGLYRATLIDEGPFGVASSTRYNDVVVGGKAPEIGGFVVEAAGRLRVTVDTRGMAEAPPVAVWSTFARLVAGPKARPDAPGPGAIYRFDSLVPGRYRVVATLPDGTTMLREAEVEAGAVTPVQLTRLPNRNRPFEFMARWENMPPDIARTRWYLTALKGEGFPTTVLEAARGGGLERTNGPEPRSGPYLVRYPAHGLARRIDLGPREVWGIDLTPPTSGYLRRGHRTVRVRVLRGGKPVHDLFVGLQEGGARGTAPGAWMRYAATTEEGAVFDDLPAGRYRLTFLDRVLGVDFGATPQPRALALWGKDIDLAIELNK